jgi:hypothetical protein
MQTTNWKRLLGMVLATSGTTLLCAFLFGNWVVVRVLKGIPGAPSIDTSCLAASVPCALVALLGVFFMARGRSDETGTRENP